MPSALVLQHLAPEGPAGVADALCRAGVDVVVHRTDRCPTVPPLGDHRALVVMGGPMSAVSDDDFPSRRAELDLIGEALQRGVPVLGICLGAQLLALAAGGSVFPGAAGAEVGWAPVWVTDEMVGDPLFSVAPSRATVLHWHGDTFSLPHGARLLASSEAYPNQAFRVGPVAWGLQFHVEVDEATVRGFVESFLVDAQRAPEGPDGILAVAPAAIAALVPMRTALLDGFAQLVATR